MPGKHHTEAASIRLYCVLGLEHSFHKPSHLFIYFFAFGSSWEARMRCRFSNMKLRYHT